MEAQRQYRMACGCVVDYASNAIDHTGCHVHRPSQVLMRLYDAERRWLYPIVFYALVPLMSVWLFVLLVLALGALTRELIHVL